MWIDVEIVDMVQDDSLWLRLPKVSRWFMFSLSFDPATSWGLEDSFPLRRNHVSGCMLIFLEGIYDISDRWFAKHWGALVLVPVRSSKECVLYSRDNQGSYRSTIEISSCV